MKLNIVPKKSNMPMLVIFHPRRVVSPHFRNIYLPTTAALAYLTKTNSISTRIAKIISLESPLLSELLSVSQLFSSPDVTQTKKSLSGGRYNKIPLKSS